jgi:CopG-like RHH_1 or ribbon-helix-helix domain, RHH_5
VSRSVRIPDHLAAKIEELAKAQRRSFSNMLAVLLERSLQGDHSSSAHRLPPASSAQFTDADAQPRDIPSRTL